MTMCQRGYDTTAEDVWFQPCGLQPIGERVGRGVEVGRNRCGNHEAMAGSRTTAITSFVGSRILGYSVGQ